MAYYDAFIAKWNTLGPGTKEQKLAALNASLATGPVIPMIVPTYQIYNLISVSDFNALSSSAQQLVRDILSMGAVDASSGTQIRARFVSLFGSSTTTFSNLAALAAKYDTPQIPWWQANGYSRPFDMGDVSAAGLS